MSDHGQLGLADSEFVVDHNVFEQHFFLVVFLHLDLVVSVQRNIFGDRADAVILFQGLILLQLGLRLVYLEVKHLLAVVRSQEQADYVHDG